MDFKLNLNNQDHSFTQLNDLLDFVRTHLSQWNNFEDTTQPQICIVWKEPNNTPTLGIKVDDGIETEDVFGRS